MSDLISRQAAIDALDAICERECEYSKSQRAVMCGACRLGSAFDVVDELPSAQQEHATCYLDSPCEYQNINIALPSAERKKGWWINHRNDDGHNIADCNQCGNAIQWFDGDEIPRYCCICGAKMEGEEDGELA